MEEKKVTKELSKLSQSTYELTMNFIDTFELCDGGKEVLIGLIDLLVETIIAGKE